MLSEINIPLFLFLFLFPYPSNKHSTPKEMSSSTAAPAFPPPIIIPPSHRSIHDQTFIILHGRGSTSSQFAPPFLSTLFPNDSASSAAESNLQSVFPRAKFIFVSAPRSRATIYKRSLIPQWFDSWHLCGDDSTLHPSYNPLQSAQPEEWRAIPGLQDTVSYLHSLIRKEADLVGGTRNIVLGGISQGCAASLAALMLWDGSEGLGGYLGMCGWLPFVEAIKRVVEEAGKDKDDEWDPFQRDDDEFEGGDEETIDISASAVRALRESLELEKGPIYRPPVFDTPMFLGHGDQDVKVPITHGREAAECLKAIGFNTVSWNEYQGLGHWFSPQMLTDVVEFLKSHNKAP